MSATIRTTTTTTTTSGSDSEKLSLLEINKKYILTLTGILKLIELILGILSAIILSVWFRTTITSMPDTFFYVITIAFICGTFCLLLSHLISVRTSEILPQTIYEFIYHFVAGILLFITSIVFLAQLQWHKSFGGYSTYMASSVFGLINSILYLASTYVAFRAMTIRN